MNLLRPLGTATLAAVLLLAAGATAQPRRISFRTVDIEGRRVETRPWRGHRTVLVTFTGRHARAATRRLLTRVDEATLADDALETILVADVAAYRSFPVRGFAEDALGDALRAALRDRRARRETAGIGTRTANRFHLVPDWTGELLTAFATGPIASEPTTFVINRRGVATGPIPGSNTIASRRIIAAIEATRQPAPRRLAAR